MKKAIQLRPLTVADIPFGMSLKSLAGWNQIASDWERLLGQSQGGTYIASFKGQAAGTVTTIQYEDKFSWIGMVLVDPKWRGLGIGTQLLHAAINYASPIGPVLLDATPKGKKLYKTLGFEELYGLERLEIAAAPTVGKTEKVNIKALEAVFLPACILYDAAQFGANRGKLLQNFHHHTPAYGFIAFQGHQIAGYCLGRHGSEFEQIGPIIADNFTIAKTLFEAALSHCQGKPLIVDVLLAQSQWYQYLLSMGFKVQRPFLRMCLGDGAGMQDTTKQFAIAGPEFG